MYKLQIKAFVPVITPGGHFFSPHGSPSLSVSLALTRWIEKLYHFMSECVRARIREAAELFAYARGRRTGTYVCVYIHTRASVGTRHALALTLNGRRVFMCMCVYILYALTHLTRARGLAKALSCRRASALIKLERARRWRFQSVRATEKEGERERERDVRTYELRSSKPPPALEGRGGQSASAKVITASDVRDTGARDIFSIHALECVYTQRPPAGGGAVFFFIFLFFLVYLYRRRRAALGFSPALQSF